MILVPSYEAHVDKVDSVISTTLTFIVTFSFRFYLVILSTVVFLFITGELFKLFTFSYSSTLFMSGIHDPST